MALVITIDGNDRTDKIEWQSIDKEENLTKEPDTLQFLIRNYGTKTYRPTLGEEVVFTDGSEKVFGGVIVEILERIEGLAQYLTIICKDYTEILDGQLVSRTYTGETADDIIADMIDSFAPGLGFTTTNVVAPVVVDKIVFNYIPISKCLQKLAEYLQNFDWYVDYDKDINFFNTNTEVAPFDLTDTNGNYVFQSLQIKNESHQIRNEIYIRGGEIESASTRTEYFNGDGTRVIFALGSKFSSLPTVTVGGVGKTVGLDFLSNDADYQCMWDFNHKTIRFTSGNTPGSGTNNVVVTGTPLFPLIFRKRDEASISTYGLKQFLIVDKTIETIDAASQRADTELEKFGSPAMIGSFKTYSSGLKVGQTINIQSSIRNGLDQDFKIVSINTTLRTPSAFEHTVKILASEDKGINDILTKLLITNAADQLDVGTENIQRFESFGETIDIDDAVNAPTVTSAPYNWAPDANALYWNLGTWS